MILADATWRDVDSRQRQALIVPIGATEQHGPHLPLRTDTLLAEHVATAVQDRRSDADLAPVLAIAASGEHAPFPGTLSIGTDALANAVIELARHATQWWPALLVVNGHGGNVEALDRVADLCRSESRLIGVVHLALPGMDAHAGRAETSLMLHVAPHLVRLDQMESGPTTPVSDLMSEIREDGVRAVSPSGVLGDPREATPSEGQQWFNALVTKALRAYDTLAKLSTPQ